MTTRVTVAVPDLGDFKSVDVVDVLVRVGEEIAVDAPLVTLETDKATMDVPSSAAGRVTRVLINKGDKVSAGSAIVELEASEAASPDAAAAAAPAAPPAPVAPQPVPAASAIAPAAPTAALPPTVAASPSRPPTAAPPAAQREPVAGLRPVDEIGFARAYASPSVRLLARELGVDLGQLSGSGPKGRITREDVKAWVKRALAGAVATASASALPRVPEVDFARFGPVEVQPLTRIQRISGPRLHASWVNVPHVTQFEEADITALEEARVRLKQKALDEGIKLTPLAFVLRACARVLLQFPRFNASLDAQAENLVYKKYLHLGFASDTPNGLVVPVLRDANRKDVYELARELAALSEKARAGKLSAAEMQGGCFTVSSLGGIGGTAFTPIINAPEVAILGVSRSSMKPVYVDGQFVPRLLLPLSLSYDHRVIDGAEAARFTTALAAALADVRGLLEAVP